MGALHLSDTSLKKKNPISTENLLGFRRTYLSFNCQKRDVIGLIKRSYVNKGYVEATVIPKEARNIRVEEVAGVDNYLALQNDKGEYYLNGHWFIQWSGDYNIAGTVVRYNRQGNRDTFEAVGPITEPLHIMVVFSSQNLLRIFHKSV